ncbi:hypothetical protein BGW36DRAFT_458256 [Talaromyces proteolyticus]|uniref:Uncharacterized protein n=1 Tax=Talaromyces proteolyticus TaxID=1131652 RepID=A0AAD4Q0I3_9EURO|nr:uncharacterized protein BGW36DRAFT_458256 [Talaromyces proteolyticus]KAH8704133.1 hypothetical protein BGW36DRAFT_458256 [Talaromyces proteolyticus]
MHLFTAIAALILGTNAFAYKITLYSDLDCGNKLQDISLDVPNDETCVPFNVNISAPILSISNYAEYPIIPIAYGDPDCKGHSLIADSDGIGSCIKGWDKWENKTVALVATNLGTW